jgi:hypothetical protein
MENVGIVYAHLEYHTDIWYIFYGKSVILYNFPVLVYVSRKIWQPWSYTCEHKLHQVCTYRNKNAIKMQSSRVCAWVAKRRINPSCRISEI